MAIKQAIELVGGDDFTKEVNAVAKNGETAFKNMASSMSGSGAAIQNFFVGVTKDAPKVAEGFKQTGSAVKDFTEALHTLRPILAASGLQVGELGAFGRLASVGIAGLATAIGGSVVVAMAKMQETAANTLNQLQGLFESKTAGAAAFKQLQADAQRLGVSYTSLTPIIQKLGLAIAESNKGGAAFVFAPGQGADLRTLSKNFVDTEKAAVALFEAIRLGTGTDKEAFAATQKFTDELGRNKIVTGDMIRGLRAAGVDVTALVTLLHGGAIGAEEFAQILDKNGISVQRLGQILTFGADKIKAMTAEMETDKPKTFSDNIDALLASLQRTFIGPTAIGSLVNGALQGLTQLSDAIGALFSRPEGVKFDLKSLFDTTSMLADWNAFLAALPTTAQQAWDQVLAIFKVPVDLSQLLQSFTNIFDSVLQAAQNLWNRIKQTFSEPLTMQFISGGVPIGGGASGGLVRGPGTGTSDSILAFLSNREFVINARAVSHYGPDFFAALNAMMLPRQNFNVGGLVRSITRSMVPHFAEGGMASNAPVTFVIDRQRFDLQASAQTISDLRRYAVASQLSSAGRKPSWVR